MNQKLDCIFLDLDGPLLDGQNRHFQCYKDIITQGGGIPLDRESYWEMKRDKTSRKDILAMSKYKESYDCFLESWLALIEEKKYLCYDVLKPNVRETLLSWKDYAQAILLVTMRNNRKNLIYQLEEQGIFACFDEVINCKSNVVNGKYEALKQRHFGTAVFIGDTEEDTKTASLLGIKSIAVTNGLRRREHLNADYYVSEICEIDFRKIQLI